MIGQGRTHRGFLPLDFALSSIFSPCLGQFCTPPPGIILRPQDWLTILKLGIMGLHLLDWIRVFNSLFRFIYIPLTVLRENDESNPALQGFFILDSVQSSVLSRMDLQQMNPTLRSRVSLILDFVQSSVLSVEDL